MWFAPSKSIRSPHAISPVKAFQQVRHVLRCYSDSSVLDQERDESLLGLESYLYHARLGVTAGILHQDGCASAQRGDVAHHPCRRTATNDVKRQPLSLGQ